MKKTLILLIGPMAAGKTTLAQQLMIGNPEHIYADVSTVGGIISDKEVAKATFKDADRVVICVDNIASMAVTNTLLRFWGIYEPDEFLAWNISQATTFTPPKK